MGQGKSCEAPEDAQKGIEDLALAGLLLVAPRILVAEKDGRSPADSLGETHLLQEGKYAGTTGPVQPGPSCQGSPAGWSRGFARDECRSMALPCHCHH